MTRLLTILLIFAALPMPSLANPGDAAAIMQLVAASEARIHQTAAVRRTCIHPATFATALDMIRNMRRNLARRIEPGWREPAQREQLRELGAPDYRWLRPSAAPSAASTDNAPLPPAEARALSDAAGTIIRSETRPPLVERIDAAWLPGYAFCATGNDHPALGFSAPAIRGDIAFVETSFFCGEPCGTGLLYALRRDARGWTIVAVAVMWTA